MTRAAIYARYSSEGQREASIEDQARNCEQRAKHEGWSIVKRYKDQAISGTQDENGRPGFKTMLRDAEAKLFDVLLVDDLSRLSRDLLTTERTRRRLVYWGIRLIGVSDGVDTATKGHKVLSGIKGIMNDVFLDDLADKTHRGLTGQALKGFSCGGRTYGYKPIPIYHPTEQDEYGHRRIIAAKREIDPVQAKWVRQIFQWYADGKSPRWIAGELNRLGVPGPASMWKRRNGRAGTWSASALHGHPQAFTGLLNNPLYKGVLIWNRRHWVRNPETKRKVPRLRPESEWIVVEQPELRIVPPKLWEQVHQRRLAQGACQARNGKLGSGRPPKFLLSGLLKCGECGSNFVVQSYYQYGCAGRINRGAAHCGNHLRVARTLVEEKCLASIRRDLLTPEAFALFKKETARLLTERQRQQGPELKRVQKHLAEVERVIANIMKAIKDGIVTRTTKAELERAEAEQVRLQERLQAGSKAEAKVLTVLPQAEERYQKLVENLGRLPARNVDEARQQIKDLVGEIKLVPTTGGYLEAEMAGRYAGLLKLAVGQKLNNVVAGGGFEPPTFGLCVPRQLSLPGLLQFVVWTFSSPSDRLRRR